MTTGDVVYSLRFSLIKILPEPRFDLGSTAGESCVLTARLHMLYDTVCVQSVYLQNFHYRNLRDTYLCGAYSISLSKMSVSSINYYVIMKMSSLLLPILMTQEVIWIALLRHADKLVLPKDRTNKI